MTSLAVDEIAFDAFETVRRITQPTNPYHELSREGRRQDLKLAPDSGRIAMTTNHLLDETVARLGILLTRAKREELSRALQQELASIQAFPGAKAAITLLRKSELKGFRRSKWHSKGLVPMPLDSRPRDPQIPRNFHLR